MSWGAQAAALALAASALGQDFPLSPADALKSFELADGLTIELVAAEPLIASPCAMAFDERGRLFVAENRGYPNQAEPPQGRVVMLEDTDGDGRMDQRTVVADGLTFPNGVMPWKGGLFVTCAPDLLYLKDTDGDGRADERVVVLTGFDTARSTQLRVNAPLLGPDGWIWLAAGSSGGKIRNPAHPGFGRLDLKSDLRFDPNTGRFEAVDGRSQYGQSFDDFGRRFICVNRIQVQHVVLPSRSLRRNPHLAFSDTVQNCPDLVPNPLKRDGGGAARIFPISKNLTAADSHAGTFSAACGVTIWRGGALPPSYEGCAFSCDPTGNLVHVDRLEPRGATFAAVPLVAGREFLASRDDWFRPVFLASGPDGALYVCDMYRKIIEHPDYLAEDIRKRTDFESGKEIGRIWRIKQSAGDGPSGCGLSLSNAPAVAGFSRGWVQQTAFRLLVEAPPDPQKLRAALREKTVPAGDAALLQLLAISRRLEPADISIAIDRGHAGVIEVALALAREHDGWIAAQFSRLGPLAGAPDPRTRFAFALALAGVGGEDAANALGRIALHSGGDKWTTAAVLSSATGRTLDLVRGMQGDARAQRGMEDFYREAGRVIGAGKEAASPGELADLLSLQSSNAFALLAGFAEARALTLSDAEPRVAELLRGAAAAATGTDRIEGTPGQRRALAAEGLAMREQGPMDSRERAALALLARAEWAFARAPLTRAAFGSGDAELAEAALRTLAGFNSDEVAPLLLTKERWAACTPGQRETLLGALLDRQANLAGVLDAMETGALPGNPLSASRRRQFLNAPDAAIRQRAEKLFELPSGDRMKIYEEAKAALALAPQPAHGREIFRTLCATCHRLDREGAAVGPDLFDIRRQPKETILLHIVVPEFEMAPGFAAYFLETKDGRSLAGILISETPQSVTLRQPGGAEETILRTAVAHLAASPLSLMPQGLESAMSRQDLADLLAYLRGEN